MQVEDQEFTVQSYLNQFEAPQIYYRAYYATLISNEHFNEALKILVNSKLIWMIKDIVERANRANISINPQYLKLAQEKINEENRSYISKSQLKNQEIMQLRQSSSRVQLRFSYKDLALIHIEAGNFSAANNELQKTNEYNGKEKNYDFAYQYGLSSIWSQNQNVFNLMSVPQPQNLNGNVNHLNDDQILYQQYLATLALRNFQQMEFAAYLRVIKEVDLENPWINQCLTRREDLGIYYILSALHSNKGEEFEKDLTHDKVRLLLDENQPVLQLIESYRNFDYPLMLNQLQGLLDELKYDHHSRKILGSIKEKILIQIALQYISAHQELVISDLQNSFMMDGEQIMVFLENLIVEKKIPYLIDPVKQILHKRYSPKQSEMIEFNKIQKQITDKALNDQITLMNSTFLRKEKQEHRFMP